MLNEYGRPCGCPSRENPAHRLYVSLSDSRGRLRKLKRVLAWNRFIVLGLATLLIMGIGFAERSDPSGNPIESASAKVEQPLQVPPDGEGREENTGALHGAGHVQEPDGSFPLAWQSLPRRTRHAAALDFFRRVAEQGHAEAQ